MTFLVKRPVAFRVARPDSNPGFSLFHDEKLAASEAELCGGDYQALFVRDGTAIVAEWEPIETAPIGNHDFYLVCCNDPGDCRSPFVVRGSIFASARKHPPAHHLSLAYLTHWMPLPAKPALTSQERGNG